MKKTAIKKIVIEIGGVDISVTPEEARNLHQALSELLNLPEKVKVVEKQVIRDRWRDTFIDPYPRVIWTTTTGDNPTFDKYRISCSSESALISKIM